MARKTGWMLGGLIGGSLVIIGLAGLGSGWLLQHYDENIAFEQEAELVAEVLELAPGQTVADVRAGAGRWTAELARRVGPEGQVYATAGPNPPHEIYETVAAAGVDNVSVITRTPGESTRLPEGCCDAILIRAVFHHLAEERPTLPDTFFQNLQPGGLLAIIDYDEGTQEHASAHGISSARVRQIFTSVGFEQAQFIEDWPGHAYCIVFRRPSPSTVSGRQSPEMD